VTTGLTGAVSTKVAPFGWTLEYDVSPIQIYKMKHIDDTDRYVRFCFETSTGSVRNSVAVCIGKTANLTTGVIDDALSLQSTAAITSLSAANIPKWDTYYPTSEHNNWTCAQGLSTYGVGMCVGSPYHFAFLSCDGYTSAPHHIYGIFPSVCHGYPKLDYPLLIGLNPSSTSNTLGSPYGNFSRADTTTLGHASIGGIRVRFDRANVVSNKLINGSYLDISSSSVLSAGLDSFNTTTAMPLSIFEHSTSQHLGQCYGLFLCQYANNTAPEISIANNPHITADVDFQNLTVVAISAANNTDVSATRFLAIPVEQIKYGA